MNKPQIISSLFHLGIRQKMILVLLTVLLIALTSTSWLTLLRYKEDVLKETTQRGEDVTQFVSQSLVFSIVGYDYHTIQLLLDRIVKTQDIVYAVVENKKGNIMAEVGEKPQKAEDATLFTEDISFDNEVLAMLTVGFDNNRIIEQLENKKTSLIAREIIIIVLIAIGEFFALSYIIVRPVTTISRFLKSGIDENGKVIRDVPIKTSDEFGRLAYQFNEIRHQLSTANERLQSKVDLADSKLKDTNFQLLEQSAELRRMNEELKRMAITDALTGLYNRRHFEHLMATEILLSLRHREPNSILIIDVDHFKKINDTHGHKAGDRILRRIASILAENLRRSDILCRVGGEEFVALCKRVEKETALQTSEKLRKTIAHHPFMVGEKRLNVTVSVGVATIPNAYNTKTTDDLFEQADNALYFSKENGRNRSTHFSDIVEHPHETEA